MQIEGFSDVSEVLRAGVYILAHRGTIVYVGKSKSMHSRIYTHRNLWNQSRRGKAGAAWLPSTVKGMLFDEVYIRACTVEQLDELERSLIIRYAPRYNIVHKPPSAQAVPITLSVRGQTLTLNARHVPRIERRI